MTGEKYNIQLEAIEIFNRLQQVPQLTEGLSNLLQNFNSHNHDLRNDTRYQPLGDYAADAHTHTATDISEDSTHKFMTQTEKNTLSSLGTNAALKDFSNVTTKNLGQNGYYKLPDGLMIQWGCSLTGVTNTRTIYLPQSFYDTNYSVVLCSSPGGKSITNSIVSPCLISRSYSSFVACNRYFEGAIWGYGSWDFYWIAIGKWK